MRHGEAEAIQTTDRARELTANGRREVAAVARGLRGSVGSLDRIICSPYTRARQTAALVADGLHLGAERIEEVGELASGADTHKALQWLVRNVDEDVLAVGHMPMVAELGLLLQSGGDVEPVSFRPASVLALEADGLAPGCAEELWVRHVSDW